MAGQFQLSEVLLLVCAVPLNFCSSRVQDRLHFSAEQTGQILAARATMLNRARTIFNERQNIISAVEVSICRAMHTACFWPLPHSVHHLST